MSSPSTDVDFPAGSLNAELGALVDEFMVGVTERIGRLAECGSDVELIDAVQSVERAVRSAEQAACRVVSAVETRGLFHLDGHADAKAWLRAGVNGHPEEAVRRHRVGRFTRAFPQAAEALAVGRLGVGHVNKLALAWSNPRVRHEFEGMIDVWLLIAASKPFTNFCGLLETWVRETDLDGGHRTRDDAHQSRDFRFLTVGESTLLRGELCGIQAEILQQIFQAFVDAEYRHDVDEAKAVHGVDVVTEQLLARTPGQRRGDALVKLFEAAACAPLNGAPIKITVDVVVDQETFEDQLLAMLDPFHEHRRHATVPWPTDDPHGAAGPARDEHLAGIRPSLSSDAIADIDDEVSPDADDWIAEAIAAAQEGAAGPARVASMCRTRRGTPVAPADAVVASLIGHVRRVVVGARGVIIDVGERNTLFTGSARDAALLQAAIDGNDRCIWPGCGRLPRQIDHTIPRCEGGATAPHNAGPMCGRHNIFKTTGYRTRRDATGTFHIYRADGTEVAAI